MQAEIVVAEIRDAGGSAEAMAFDIANAGACAAATADLLDRHGAPYAIVNNAGVIRDGLMVWMKPDDWSDVLRTNLDGSTRFTDELTLAILTGWTQMFGLLSFELSNQTSGIVEHHRDLFDSSARLMAAQIGLADSD